MRRREFMSLLGAAAGTAVSPVAAQAQRRAMPVVGWLATTDPKRAAPFVAPEPFFISRRKKLAALAAHHAVPAVYPWRVFADAGGLISYGPNLVDAYRVVGVYTGKILNGAKLADLPVMQPTTYELVINLKTVRSLGLTVPRLLFAQATEVIE